MANDTKERILNAALELFSSKGYEGANIRELSNGLGLTKSAFYKHYQSKEAVWNAILDEMTQYYEANFGSDDRLPPIPGSREAFTALVKKLFAFTTGDERIIMTRRLLLTEQFRDERVRALATKHFNDGLESMFARIFAGMMENGVLKKGDPAMLAFAFAEPVSALVHLSDREPERRAEAADKVLRFTEHFLGEYGA